MATVLRQSGFILLFHHHRKVQWLALVHSFKHVHLMGSAGSVNSLEAKRKARIMRLSSFHELTPE